MEESQERNELSNGGSFAHSQVSSEITKLQKEQANGDAQSDSGHLIDLVSESIEVHKFNDPVNDAHNWLDEESSNEKHTGLINSEDEQLANSNFELNGVEILESNQCVICCGRLTDGRVLTCLHRACYSCAIEEAYSIADKLQSNSCNKEIECPKCSQITSLAHLVKDLISLKPEDENHLVGAAPVLGVCTACKNGEKAIGKCDTCKSELCSSCVSAHQTMRCFETHSLVVCDFAASNAGLKCTKHVGEYLEYFCSTCREFCCRTCLRNAHMSTSELNGASSPHTYYQIDEKLIQKSAQHLKYIIEESKEKLAPCNELIADLNACIDELSLNKESVKQAIDEQYHSIKAHLDKYHQELIGQLNIMHQQRRLQLWDSINSCQKAIERVEETISYANLFASENFEVQRQNFIEFIKLKELIAYQLQMLINYASADISKHKKALSSDVAVRASGISFKTADLKTMEATLPKYFGELLPPNNLNQSSNERDVSRHQISFGNGEAQIHLDFASARRSVAFPRPDVGSNLIKSFSPVSTTPTAVQADHLLCSSRSVIASGMPEVKLKPNFYSSLSTEDNEFYSTQPSLIKANIATGLNLKIDNHTASDYSPNDVSLRSPRGETLDLSDANIQMNLAQLALIHNADNQHGSSKVLSATLSRQASFGNSAASPGNSPFIMNDETLKNISELAKLTQQQNGLPSFTTSLTTPTPPSSSGNTPPLPFPNVSPRPGSKVNIMQIRSKFGQLGTQKGHFSSPHGFCLGVDEEIVVADTNNHRICFFDKNGEFRHMFGVPGKDDGQLWYPRKVAVLRANGPGGVSTPRYVVCDRGSERSRMQIFSRNGHFIRKIAIRYIDIVAGLAITPSGYIVAVDSVSPTVFVIAESGDLLRWFDCSEHMGEPSDIAVNGQEFYICDFKGHCVVVFSEDGHFLRRIGREGITNFPNGIDISDAGDILVGDSHGNRFHVTVFGKDGVPLSEFECPHIKVSRCCGLKITREGYVITLAKNNHHVLILNTLYIM